MLAARQFDASIIQNARRRQCLTQRRLSSDTEQIQYRIPTFVGGLQRGFMDKHHCTAYSWINIVLLYRTKCYNHFTNFLRALSSNNQCRYSRRTTPWSMAHLVVPNLCLPQWSLSIILLDRSTANLQDTFEAIWNWDISHPWCFPMEITVPKSSLLSPTQHPLRVLPSQLDSPFDSRSHLWASIFDPPEECVMSHLNIKLSTCFVTFNG